VYCNWNKDLFFGVLPDAQYGDTSVVDISYGTSGIPAVTFGKVQAGQETGLTAPSSTLSVLDSGANLTLDVLALRRGEALQRFREISLCTPTNYFICYTT
jgi:hypothetical protein